MKKRKQKFDDDYIDEVAGRILSKLRIENNQNRSDLRQAVSVRIPVEAFNEALSRLKADGKIYITTYQPSVGRPGRVITLR